MTFKLEPVQHADLVTPVPLRWRMHLLCSISIAAVLLTGCDRDPQIVAYQAPKDSPEPAAATAQAFEVGPIRGIVPPGWRLDPRARPPRLATFVITDGIQQAEVTITRFPGNVGGTLANVNRWRRQVDLSAIDDLSQLDSARVIIDKLPGKVFQFRAPGDVPDRRRIVVATVKRDDVSWFFKLSGPHDLLESQIEPFVTFVVAIEFTDEADT